MGLKNDSPEKRIVQVAEKILTEECDLRVKKFHWNDGLITRIKSAYRDQYGPIASNVMKIINERMNNPGWRHSRLQAVRASSNIGIVEERIGGVRVGDVGSRRMRTAAFRAAQNAEEGRGVQMSIGLPPEDLGLIIECLLEIQAHKTPKELPPHLRHLFLKDADDSVLRDVISKQFDMAQKWLKDATGNNMNMPARQVLQSMRTTFKQIERLVTKRKFRNHKDPDLARQQEIDLRKYTVLTCRELMLGEEALLGQGYVLLLPVIVSLSNGKELRFPAVATMVSGEFVFSTCALIYFVSHMVYCLMIFSQRRDSRMKRER